MHDARAATAPGFLLREMRLAGWSHCFSLFSSARAVRRYSEIFLVAKELRREDEAPLRCYFVVVYNGPCAEFLRETGAAGDKPRP